MKSPVMSAGEMLSFSTWVIWPIFSARVMRASRSFTRSSTEGVAVGMGVLAAVQADRSRARAGRSLAARDSR